MKNILATAAIFIGLLSSCNSQAPFTVNGESMELADGVYTKVATNKGDILIQLDIEKAPLTASNFIALAEGNHPLASEEFKGKPFFDGLIFHRVIPDFMIQGGDPQGNGMGGPGYKFDNEISKELVHNKGVISMANSGPNTNGSQFFITVKDTRFLDGKYNVFGKVVSGQEVADSISMVSRNPQDRPNEEVIMEKVSIIRIGADAEKFDAAATFQSIIDEKAKAKAEKEAKIEATLKEKQAGMEVTERGLFYKVLEEGTGAKPEMGQSVLMNYSGFLLDGTLFDSSIESVAKEHGKYNAQRPYQPFETQVGPQARVIEGWKEALSMMKVGDKYELLIPPALAYGERGAGGLIPPNAWLTFEVEMVSIK